MEKINVDKLLKIGVTLTDITLVLPKMITAVVLKSAKMKLPDEVMLLRHMVYYRLSFLQVCQMKNNLFRIAVHIKTMNLIYIKTQFQFCIQ